MISRVASGSCRACLGTVADAGRCGAAFRAEQGRAAGLLRGRHQRHADDRSDETGVIVRVDVRKQMGSVTADVLARWSAQAQATEAERRYAQARGAIDTLQRELLPSELPVLPGTRIAGSYLLAGRGGSAGATHPGRPRGDRVPRRARSDRRIADLLHRRTSVAAAGSGHGRGPLPADHRRRCSTATGSSNAPDTLPQQPPWSWPKSPPTLRPDVVSSPGRPRRRNGSARRPWSCWCVPPGTPTTSPCSLLSASVVLRRWS
jgi:hypothetical protein